MNSKLMNSVAFLVILYSAYLAYIDVNFRHNFGQIAYVYICGWSQGKDDEKNEKAKHSKKDKKDKSSKK